MTRERFAYLDWIALPNRMTPSARPLNERLDTAVVQLALEGRDGGRARVEAELARFAAHWRDLTGVAATGAVDSGDHIGKIANVMIEWLAEDQSRQLAIAVEPTGLVAVAMGADRSVREQQELELAGFNQVERNIQMREALRTRLRAEGIALLAVHLTRLMISPASAAASSLRSLARDEFALYDLNSTAVRPVPVTPDAVAAGSEAEFTGKLLSEALALFSARTEAMGPGGAREPPASREAFLSLSTRFGALVDEVVPALDAGDADTMGEQSAVASASRSYFWGACALGGAFLASVILPNLLPGNLWGDMTIFGHALYFALFAVLSILAFMGTLGEEERSTRPRLGLRYADETDVISPKDTTSLRVQIWLSDWNRDGGLFAFAAILIAVWGLLRVSGLGSVLPKPEFNTTTLRTALEGAVWLLPVIALAALKEGYDRLETYTKTVYEREGRLRLLADLEAALGMARRFATNMKVAFSEFEPARGYARAQLQRLLHFDYAKEDIEGARVKITADADRAKASHLRRAGATAALALLLVGSDALKNWQPKLEKRPSSVPEATLAALDRSAKLPCELPTDQNVDKASRCTYEELAAFRHAEFQRSFTTGVETSLAGMADGAHLPRQVNIELPEIERRIRQAFHGAFLDNFEPRLRVMIQEAFNQALANADVSPLRGKTATEVEAGASDGFASAATWPIKVPVRTLIQEAFKEAASTADLGALEPQVRQALMRAIEKAISNANYKPIYERTKPFVQSAIGDAFAEASLGGLEPRLGELVERTVKRSINQVFVGDLVNRLWPRINEAVQRALGQDYRLDLKAVNVDAGVREALAGDMTQVVLALFSGDLKISCPDESGGHVEASLPLCLARKIAVDIAVHRYVPDVPTVCTANGAGLLVARYYFLRPPLTREQVAQAGKRPENCRPKSNGATLHRICDTKIGTQSVSLPPSADCRQTCDPNIDFEAGKARLRKVVDEGLARVKGTGRQIIVVGYTDSSGRPETNLAISTGRANLIKDALRATEPPFDDTISISSVGRGEISQSTLWQGNAAESEMSRRADVWVCPLQIETKTDQALNR